MQHNAHSQFLQTRLDHLQHPDKGLGDRNRAMPLIVDDKNKTVRIYHWLSPNQERAGCIVS